MKSLKNAVYSHLIDRDRYQLEVTITDQETRIQCRIASDSNEPGQLYRISAAFLAHGWEINEATIRAVGDTGFVNDFILLRTPGKSAALEGNEEIKAIVNTIESLLYGNVPVMDFLNEREIYPGGGEAGQTTIQYLEGKMPGLEIRGVYDTYFFLRMFQSFYLMDVDVRDGEIIVEREGVVKSLFWMDAHDIRFTSSEFTDRLIEEVKQSL